MFLQVIQAWRSRGESPESADRDRGNRANRGDILDRNGRVLAYSVEAESIYAVPSEIDNVDKIARAVRRRWMTHFVATGRQSADRIRRGRSFAYVERQVSPDAARRVAALKLDGVGLMKESRRYYPNKELGAHVLGRYRQQRTERY